MPDGGSMTTPSNVLTELRDAINAHDPARIAACFSDDYCCERPTHPAESFTGSDQVRRNYTQLLERCPDLRAEILRTAIDGDELWSEWEMRATGPAGAPVFRRGPVIATVRENQIDWARFYIDAVDPAAA
jgi:ketosteroid isomerase-like protein